jgi:hypothetical protein
MFQPRGDIMKKPIAALLTLVGILSAGDANAQHFFHRGHSRGTVVSAGPSYRGQARASSAVSSPWLNPAGVATQPSSTAPLFRAGGGGDFPFFGVPYGHAYHSWSFTALSGAYGQNLARYYDPPVK